MTGRRPGELAAKRRYGGDRKSANQLTLCVVRVQRRLIGLFERRVVTVKPTEGVIGENLALAASRENHGSTAWASSMGGLAW
jgi:hypothetical protein